jgi:hypothetical protein
VAADPELPVALPGWALFAGDARYAPNGVDRDGALQVAHRLVVDLDVFEEAGPSAV